MKANELRIGNFIADYEAEPNKTIYWQVETIEHLNKTLGVRFRNGSCWTCEEMIEPIQLTEEWLLKFGFDKINLGYICKKRMIYISKEFYYCALYFSCEDNIEIQYVHQLQNLYFALTGEELTLKS